MVPVLLATPRIAAGCLQMPQGIGADPDIPIGRWNRERADSGQVGAFRYAAPIGMHIREMTPALEPSNPWLAITGECEALGVHHEKSFTRWNPNPG